jgi:hypothetical protein
LVLLNSHLHSLKNHHSLKSRFCGAVTGAILVTSSQEKELFPYVIDAVIIGSAKQQDGWLYAIATGLFHHQKPDQLNNYLSNLEELILSLVIAYACCDALNPKSLISEICDEIEQLDIDTNPTIRKLRLAQDLVEQGQSAAIARLRLGSGNIAFGLYCFLSTPDSWELATLRAGKMQVVVGAIAGAFQGRIPYGSCQDASRRESVAMGIKLGDRLLGAWSGVYDLNNIKSDFYPAITAPDLLGRRL